MQPLYRSIPVFTFHNDEMFIQALTVPEQDVDLPCCARFPDQSHIVFDRYVAGLMKCDNEFLESTPVFYEFRYVHFLKRQRGKGI